MLLGYCTFHKFYYVLVITAGSHICSFWLLVGVLTKPPKTSLDLPQRLLVISIQCPFGTGCFANFCTVGL